MLENGAFAKACEAHDSHVRTEPASVGARFEEGFLLATHTSVGSQRRCSRVAPKNRRTTRRAFCVGLGPTRDRDHSRESAWLRPRLARVPHFSRRALPRNPPAAHDSRRMPPCNPRQRGHGITRARENPHGKPTWQPHFSRRSRQRGRFEKASVDYLLWRESTWHTRHPGSGTARRHRVSGPIKLRRSYPC